MKIQKMMKTVVKWTCLLLGLPINDDGLDYLIFRLTPNKKPPVPQIEPKEETIDPQADHKPKYIRMTF